MRFQSEKWDFKVRFDVSILVRKMRNEISKWEMRYQSEKWISKWDLSHKWDLKWEMRFQSEKWDFKVRFEK